MKKYKIIRSESQLKKLAKRMRTLDEFAFDTETNTLKVYGLNKDFKLVGISISWGKYNNYYLPVGHYFDDNQLPLDAVVKYLKPIFENPKLRIIGHNLKFDLHVLARIGIFIKTIDLWDTMVMSWLIDENSDNGLKQCTKRDLGIDQTKIKDVLTTVTKEEKKSVGLKANQKPTFDLVRIDVGAEYAVADAYYTWLLYLYYYDKLEEEEMLKIYEKVYRRFLYTLYMMEERGVTVDLVRLEQMSREMEEDIENLEYRLYELAGVEFNPNSSQHLAELLFGYGDFKNPNGDILSASFNFPVISVTAKGVPQTSSGVLEKLAKKEYKSARKQEGVELVKVLLEYKKLRKLKTAFIDGLKDQIYDDGKVHPSFNIVGTTSGRISCSNPNLQQLPKASDDDKYKIRSLFIGSINSNGRRNKIIALDYKNLEMVLLAHFSQDPYLVETFLEGHDSHGATAVNMFGLDCDPDECKKLYPTERQVGKVLNFGLMYGMSAYTLYNTLKDWGVDLDDPELLKKYNVKKGEEVAQIYYDKYFETYSGVARFIKNQKRFAHRHGYVYTLVGRKRRLPNINSQNYKQVAYEERLSVNAPIQGSAGDIMMNAQIRIEVDERLKELRAKMLIQVHDKLICRV
ncbi:MAG: hypothetical protein H0Z24_05510 [Thermosipho sp. (in: Bacteria)]|nr:hypothetical protein [Thermosipho sp. (in: thermotogales)]